jgi:hypothetical protein
VYPPVVLGKRGMTSKHTPCTWYFALVCETSNLHIHFSDDFEHYPHASVPHRKGFIQLLKGKYEENEFFYSAFVDLLVKIERMATTQRREIS